MDQLFFWRGKKKAIYWEQEDIGLVPKIYKYIFKNDKWADSYKLRYGALESVALYHYMYNHNPEIFLNRKKIIFEQWISERGEDYREINCDICGKKFTRQSNRSKHCPQCSILLRNDNMTKLSEVSKLPIEEVGHWEINFINYKVL
jgi:hypothetical protein